MLYCYYLLHQEFYVLFGKNDHMILNSKQNLLVEQTFDIIFLMKGKNDGVIGR